MQDCSFKWTYTCVCFVCKRFGKLTEALILIVAMSSHGTEDSHHAPMSSLSFYQISGIVRQHNQQDKAKQHIHNRQISYGYFKRIQRLQKPNVEARAFSFSFFSIASTSTLVIKLPLVQPSLLLYSEAILNVGCILRAFKRIVINRLINKTLLDSSFLKSSRIEGSALVIAIVQ